MTIRNSSQKITLRLPRVELAEVAVLMLFVSLHLYGVGVIKFYGLSIAPWDWAILILAFLSLIWLTAHGKALIIRSSFKPVLFLASLFTLWMGVSALVSPQTERGLTMLLLQMRNLFFLFLIGILFSNITSIAPLNGKLFRIGSVIAILAILMYIFSWFRYLEIVSSPRLWKPTIGYNLDQGGVLRLIGFARDPNFYSLWIALPFFIGFTKQFSLRHLLIFIPIGLSVILAMSRGFAIGFLASIAILSLVGRIIKVKKRNLKEDVKRYIKMLFVGIALYLMVVIGFQFIIGFDIHQFAKRIELVGETPRWNMWNQLKEAFTERWNPITGLGLRAAEESLEGAYSHNTYLDVLFETGLVGFAIFNLLLFYVTVFALKRITYLEWIPYVQTWFVLLVMFGAFSLGYNPFTWLMIGVLTACPVRGSKKAVEKINQ